MKSYFVAASSFCALLWPNPAALMRTGFAAFFPRISAKRSECCRPSAVADRSTFPPQSLKPIHAQGEGGFQRSVPGKTPSLGGNEIHSHKTLDFGFSQFCLDDLFQRWELVFNCRPDVLVHMGFASAMILLRRKGLNPSSETTSTRVCKTVCISWMKETRSTKSREGAMSTSRSKSL